MVLISIDLIGPEIKQNRQVSDAEVGAIAVAAAAAAAVAAACYLRLFASYHATRHDNVVNPVTSIAWAVSFRIMRSASHTPELTYPTVIV